MGRVAAGLKRHRLIIERQTLAEGASGARLQNWDMVRTVWASIDALKGDKLISARQIAATATHAIAMDYFADVVPSCRGRIGDTVYEFNSVLSERNMKYRMDIIATERII